MKAGVYQELFGRFHKVCCECAVTAKGWQQFDERGCTSCKARAKL